MGGLVVGCGRRRRPSHHQTAQHTHTPHHNQPVSLAQSPTNHDARRGELGQSTHPLGVSHARGLRRRRRALLLFPLVLLPARRCLGGRRRAAVDCSLDGVWMCVSEVVRSSLVMCNKRNAPWPPSCPGVVPSISAFLSLMSCVKGRVECKCTCACVCVLSVSVWGIRLFVHMNGCRYSCVFVSCQVSLSLTTSTSSTADPTSPHTHTADGEGVQEYDMT